MGKSEKPKRPSRRTAARPSRPPARPARAASRPVRPPRVAARPAKNRTRAEPAAIKRDLDEALEQRAALTEVLRAMGDARDDVRPVLQTIVDSALRLCRADWAGFFRREKDEVILEASAGRWPGGREVGTWRPIEQQGLVRMAFTDLRSFHSADIWDYENRFSTDPNISAEEWAKVIRSGDPNSHRSRLAVPVLREADAIGVIRVQRQEPGGFTPRQVELIESFASQAAIAIENVRLFNQTKEALERQTATSNVLNAISESAFDLQPMFERMLSEAATICRADYGVLYFLHRSAPLGGHVAAYNLPEHIVRTNRQVTEQVAAELLAGTLAPAMVRKLLGARVYVEGHTVHVSDVAQDPDLGVGFYQELGVRAVFGVPMRRKDQVRGVITLWKKAPGPFDESAIKLVESFADQAVIAIENVRLFNETKEGLEQQTAIAEVLKTISRSAFELKPVLDTVVENAARLCGADAAWMTSIEGDDMLVPALAHFGTDAEGRPLTVEIEQLVTADAFVPDVGQQVTSVAGPRRRIGIGRSSIMSRPAAELRSVASADITTDPTLEQSRFALRIGVRSVLGVPMIRDGKPIGVFVLARHAVRPFSQREIELAETFADQAAIAIDNVRLFNETKDALERQTATAEVLRAISDSPADVQPVLDAITLNAARYCRAVDVNVAVPEGDQLRMRSHHGPLESTYESWPLDRTSTTGLAVLEGRTVHVADLQSADAEFPLGAEAARTHGLRAHLSVPFVRKGLVLGVMQLRRAEAVPFSPREIELAETFAAQGAIAIENVRLFNETKESLEQQRAIADVLRAISRATTDAQPVLDAAVEQAATLCEADAATITLRDGEVMRVGATWHMSEEVVRVLRETPQPIDRGSTSGRVMVEGRTILWDDVLIDPELSSSAHRIRDLTRARSVLGVPLLKDGVAIGVLNLRRYDVKPFSERHTRLVETFAEQAAIAIENVRLFNETKEALEQQTAVSEILNAMSGSPSDIQPVLDAIAANAARYCAVEDAFIYLISGDRYTARAHVGPIVQSPSRELPPVDRGWVMGRAIIEKRIVHVPDMLADDAAREFPGGHAFASTVGLRGALAAPLVMNDEVLGVIGLRRREPRAFTDHEIRLVRTFADQALIAIENVRLFNETKEALEQQTATAEVLKTISRSAFDLHSVLGTLIENAARLCKADCGWMASRSAQIMAMAGLTAEERQAVGDEVTRKLREPRETYRPGVMRLMFTEGSTVHITDIAADPAMAAASPAIGVMRGRTVLAVPVRQQENATAGIVLVRREVSPFSEREIELLQTFADQAAIAIENVRLFNETKEALERQTATAEVLKVISRSAQDLQPVFQAILESATRLSGTTRGGIYIREGNVLRSVVHIGLPPGRAEHLDANPETISMDNMVGRAFLTRETLHVADASTDPDPGDSSPLATRPRTVLAIPMVQEEEAIGVIALTRGEVRPFSPNDISLVTTFADQAVIAIENVRLFNETKEALERQTALAGILRAISASPTDVQPVLDAIAENAARFCAAEDATVGLLEEARYVIRAHFGNVELDGLGGAAGGELDDTFVTGHAILERRTVHVPDLQAAADRYPHGAAVSPTTHAIVATPLLRRGEPIGGIFLRRTSPTPFTASQIGLVEAFAHQAVIAIENVRLFNETKESLEQQSAIAEVLKTISRSAFDLRPVLETLVEQAARLCEADHGSIHRWDGAAYQTAAFWGPDLSDQYKALAFQQPRPPSRDTLIGRTGLTREVVHITDVLADPEYAPRELQSLGGYRTVLGVPLLRDGFAIGVFGLMRNEVRPFTERQIELVRTFADQAAIAMENVRLFNETKEALAQQTATADVLKAISGSAFELQPIFDVIVRSAVSLCRADSANLWRNDGDSFVLSAFFGAVPIHPVGTRFKRTDRFLDRVAASREIVHIPDTADDPIGSVDARRIWGTRLGVPILKDGAVLGVISLGRVEARAFSAEEIALVRTFADQAAIAIENVRLFNETKESLEQQTAVSQVLQTISRTAFDLESILRTVVENAARLCGADLAWMTRLEGDAYVHQPGGRYSRGPDLAAADEFLSQRAVRAWPVASTKSVMAACYRAAKTIRVDDIRTDADLAESGTALAIGARSVIAVPVIAESRTLGAIALARLAVRPFTAREGELVQTFANQAAIAIENVRLFNEIQEKSRQLEVASRHKSEFLANMSHELRTPLNAIIGFTEVMLEQMFGPLNEKQKEYLEDVRGSGTHLLTLINDILDLSKIEAGRIELDLGEFSVAEAIDNALTLVRERAARHGITLSADLSPDIGRIVADERKVKQILVNLLANAVKFTPENGWVGITARCEGDQITVAVRDTGIGIAPEDQERVFEEFQQVGKDPERSREGTGLGLTLSKRFVELHAGRIWVESEVGTGSTFTFSIPVRQTATVSG